MESTTSRCSDNLRAIVHAAIAAAEPGGSTWRYFTGNGLWRGLVSEQAGVLVDLIPAQPIPLLITTATALIRDVNSGFGTRQRVEDLESIARISLEGIKASGFEWPLSNSGLSDRESGRVARAYMAILRRCEPPYVTKRPWSLLSKWLHMMFPDTFAIYDKNAAKSIKAWGEREYAHVSAASLERLQFDVDNRHWVNNWQDPTWYRGILRFYSMVWECAVSAGSAQGLTSAAALLQAELAKNSHCGRARVTVWDVIDCLLWTANGDPIMLGLDG